MSLVTIAAAGYAAAVDPHGGRLHELRHRDETVTRAAAEHEHPGRWDGAVLAPWTNRIGGGRYRFAGASFDVPVNEPDRSNAIHGTVWQTRWEVTAQEPDRVTLRTVIDDVPGYPWTIGLDVTYAVDGAGLTVAARAVNEGRGTAPFGFGVHPYVGAPGGDLDRCALSFDASTRLVTDERMIPTGEVANGGTELDFSVPRPIGGTELDTSFGGLAAGAASLTISAPSGDGAVTCWWDAAFRWLQLYTPGPDRPDAPRRWIAVEPMTCPPDAFNSGRDLVHLGPGDDWSGTLGMRVGPA